jgi:hypothetical protein
MCHRALRLEDKEAWCEHFPVKLRTDNQSRLNGQDVLKPNTDYEAESDGNRIVLIEMVPSVSEVPKARLVKIGGKLLAAGTKGTNEDTQKVMAEFP